MKISLIPILAVIACIIACNPGSYHPPDNAHPVDSFRISPDATVTDNIGKVVKLADVIKSDSTLVMRVTGSDSTESQHIILYKIRWFTDGYPPTDSIIILADEQPTDSGWGLQETLRTISLKIRVFKIASSLLPPVLERGKQSYVFYLDKKLQASGVYVPDSLMGDKTNNYFARAAAIMKREETNPLLKHTEGMGRSYESYASNTEMYLGNRQIDVGSSVINSTHYEDFYFLNMGRNPLVIYKVRNNWSGSGCSVALPDNAIRPGQRGRIRVYYKPRKYGSFRNEIRIYSNASGSPHTFVITGTTYGGRRTVSSSR